VPINLPLPQVTRIPIVGPPPFNTLVCVSISDIGAPTVPVEVGKLSRWSWTVSTPFKLAGFDQRVPPLFQHSTTAWLSSVGPFEDDNWILAVDQVLGAGFDQDGTFFTNIAMALLPGADAVEACTLFADGSELCLYYSLVQVTSFVLCYEPPLTPPPGSTNWVRGSANAAQIWAARPHSALEQLAQLLGVPAKITVGSGGEKSRDRRGRPPSK
jgi:hypothetical protein